MATERLIVKPGAGFDPSNKAHVEQVLARISEATDKGTGWQMQSFNPETGELTLHRQSAVTQILKGRRDSYEVALQQGTKPTDGDRVAAQLESDPAHAGYFLTKFDPYVGTATLSRMRLDERRCRAAIATALGVKPWDVQVKAARGGFEVTLPNSYVPSKHDEKLQEVAESVIGQLGWYWTADAAKLTGEIVPADPPTFPPTIPYPMELLPTPIPGGVAPIPFGQRLADRGDEENTVAYLRLEDAPHGQVGGTSGAGKMLGLSQLLPTPTGWTTMGELKVGDEVLGRDGKPCRVTFLSDINYTPDLYRITLSDGQTIDADADHQWVVATFADRNGHRLPKHVSAIERHAARQRAAVELRRLAAKHSGDKLTLVELHDIVSRVEGTEWELVDSLRSALAFMEVPIERTPYVVERKGREPFVRKEPLSGFAAKPALLALASDWERPLASRGGALRAPRASQLERARVARAVAERVGHQELSVAGLCQVLTDGGAALSASSANTVTATLARAGVEPVKGYREVAYPGSKATTVTRWKNTYDAEAALNALAARIEFLTQEAPRLGADERIMTTAEMLAEGLTAHNAGTQFAIRVTAPLELPEADLPVAPYTLGAWLGDGSTSSGGFTGVDPEIMARIEADGYQVSHHPQPKAHYIRGLMPGLRAAGVLDDKRIPIAYLRASYAQRLEVLRGLMDTDGTVSERGGCELSLNKADLARDALELIRSLGIKATMTEGVSSYRLPDGTVKVTGTRYRIKFTTTTQVFHLPRKAERIPTEVRETQTWLYITDISPIAPEPGRCIQVDSPDSTYLAGGFVPTHNTVTLNSIIAGALAAGAELAIADVPAKAVDYELWRPFVRRGGWGCESLEENAIMLQELYKEGNRRAETLKRYGAKKLAELPPDVLATMPPVVIIVDEVTGLFAAANERPPKGLDKDHPLVVEAESKAMASGLIQSYVQKIAAEQRFVGFKLILSTQVASTATGIGTALRTNLGNKLLVGARATDGNRKLILADVTSAPEIPKNIQQAEGLIPKGVGVAELEGQPSFVFKSFYASERDFIDVLIKRGLKPLPETQLDQTRPDPAIVREQFPSLAELETVRRDAEQPQYGKGPREYEPWELDPETGKPLEGFARANAARHALSSNG